MTDQADTLRKACGRSSTLPVPCSPAGEALQGCGTSAGPGFAAHVLGASEQRRGLKGGLSVLQTARCAYLETQWSGHQDRRAASGGLALTRV